MPGPEGLDHDVGARAQLARERAGRPASRRSSDDRALVAVEAQVVGRALVDERRPPGARVVAAVRALDLDHVGAEVAELMRAQRARRARARSRRRACRRARGRPSAAAEYPARPDAHPRDLRPAPRGPQRRRRPAPPRPPDALSPRSTASTGSSLLGDVARAAPRADARGARGGAAGARGPRRARWARRRGRPGRPATTTSGSSRRGSTGARATAPSRSALAGARRPEGVDRHAARIGRMLQPALARRRLPGHLAARRRLRHPRPLPRPPDHGPDASSASPPACWRACVGAPADGARARPTTTRPRSRRCTRWLDAIAAARRRCGAPRRRRSVSARAWQRLSADGERDAWRGRVLARRLPAGDRGAQHRRARPAAAPTCRAPSCAAPACAAMGEVVARLGIDARHVIFGHTHRSGPLPDDDAGDWRLAGRRAAHEHRLLGLRVDVPRPPTGAARTGRAPRSSSTSGGDAARSCGCSSGIDAGGAQAPGSTTPA